MAYRIEFTASAEADLFAIVDYLTESYRSFGENAAEALARADRRQILIRANAQRIAEAQHRGARPFDLAPELRHLTMGRAIYWFEIDEASATVRIVAMFFGADDHLPAMQKRMLE